MVKRQSGYGVVVRYLGLMENTLQLKALFALSNLWMGCAINCWQRWDGCA